MLYQAALRCLVVVGRHHKYTVSVAPERASGKTECLSRVVAAYPSDYFHAPIVVATCEFDEFFVLIAAHCCVFASCSAYYNCCCSVIILIVY